MIVSRGPLLDLYVEGERSAVFVRDQVLVLSEIATSILLAVPESGSASLEEIVEHVVSQFGEPEPPMSATDVTRQQVHDLTAHDVLRLEQPQQSTPSPSAVDAVRRALGHVLSGRADRWQLPPEVAGADFAAAAKRHRVAPTLARHAEALDLPDDAAALLGAARRNESATVDALAHGLGELLTTLEQADVPCLAFKGLALAAQAHGDVAARGTGDHDLLVRPTDVARAVAVLRGAGWRLAPSVPEPGDTWAWRHLLANSYELPLHMDSHMVDLHWHVTSVRDMPGSFDELWARRNEVDVAGRPVQTLGKNDALRHSAAHAAKDDWRYLRGLLDIHLLAADPETWADTTRQLNATELASVGVSVRALGLPEGAPAVVREAGEGAGAAWAVAKASQDGAVPPLHARVPGASLTHGLRTMRRAGASLGDLRRYVSSAVFLPSLTARETSRSGLVAGSRVILARLRDAGARGHRLAAR